MALKVSATNFVPRFNTAAPTFTPGGNSQAADDLKAAVAAAFAAMNQKSATTSSTPLSATSNSFVPSFASSSSTVTSEKELNITASPSQVLSSSSTPQKTVDDSKIATAENNKNDEAEGTDASSSSSTEASTAETTTTAETSTIAATTTATTAAPSPPPNSWAARIQQQRTAQPSTSSSSSSAAPSTWASSSSRSSTAPSSSSGRNVSNSSALSSAWRGSNAGNGAFSRKESREGRSERGGRDRREGGGRRGGEERGDRGHHRGGGGERSRRCSSGSGSGVPVPKSTEPPIKYAKDLMLSLRDLYRAKPASLQLDEEVDPAVPEAIIADRAKAKALAAAEKGERRKATRLAKNEQPLRDKHGHIIEIKPLEVHQNRWIPMAKFSDSEALLHKACLGILNKLVPEKFSKLLEQFLELKITSVNLARGIITVLFDKACMEHGFGGLYAQFCDKVGAGMPLFADEAAAAAVAAAETDSEDDDEDDEDEDGSEEDDDSGAEEERRRSQRAAKRQARIEAVSQVSFRDLLVTHCVYAFQNAAAMAAAVKEEEKDLTEEERVERETKRRRREIGAIRFLGHLLNQGVLTIAEFVPVLSSLEASAFRDACAVADAIAVESLCRLLEVCGPKLEQEVPERIEQTMATIAKAAAEDALASRIRFMLLDLIELRSHKWVARRAQTVDPKKIDHAAAAAAAKKSDRDRISKQTDERRASHRAQKAAQASGDWVQTGSSSFSSRRRGGEGRSTASTSASVGKEGGASRGFGLDPSRRRGDGSASSSSSAPTSSSAALNPIPVSRYGPLIPWSDDDEEDEEYHQAEEAPAACGAASSAPKPPPVEVHSELVGGVGALTTDDNESYRTPIADQGSFDSLHEEDFSSDGDSFGTPLSVAVTRRADSSDSARASSLEVSDEDNNSNKGTALNNAASVEQCARSATDELLCSHDLEEALQYFADLAKEELAAVVIRVVAFVAMEASSDKERGLCSKLLRSCVDRYAGVFTPKAFAMGIAEVVADLDDILIDIPRANHHLVTLLFGGEGESSSALVSLDDVLSLAKENGASVPHSFAEVAHRAATA